jgi:L-lactate dehydrogenase (cytochrome)
MFLFSLGAGGQPGVERLLQNMHDEINRNMVLMGCKNISELNKSKIFIEITLSTYKNYI